MLEQARLESSTKRVPGKSKAWPGTGSTTVVVVVVSPVMGEFRWRSQHTLPPLPLLKQMSVYGYPLVLGLGLVIQLRCYL